VKDIAPGTFGSQPRELVSAGGKLFFDALEGEGNFSRQLWSSDGTASGTTLVSRPAPATASSIFNSQNAVVGAVAYFAANDGVNGRELWRTDGTTAGTTLVKDIVSGPDSSSPMYLANVNGTLFFATQSDHSGLWSSDGTAAGTAFLTGFPSSFSYPQGL